MISHPRKNPAIKAWLQALLQTGTVVRIPEIWDYEVRRELLRANKLKGIQRLDTLKTILGYVPITTEVMLRAAEFWAQARQQGYPTADDRSLDADVILAAQAAVLVDLGNTVTVATTNVDHLNRFVPARLWDEIS
ncbi:nuclease [Kovacikia minuta CCNUW1]|uniref:nuclease n=1 Tax=Kovacikia minuta TaxID=2931930 RepID=UPI001CCE3FF0|nr:nuclease [Kovacikia minuta CCNUW1]